jgi:pathogenesis-related protein 1
MCYENKICGHYTQMVWKSTTEFGCAKAKCTAGNKITEIVVCQYNPAGNYI